MSQVTLKEAYAYWRDGLRLTATRAIELARVDVLAKWKRHRHHGMANPVFQPDYTNDKMRWYENTQSFFRRVGASHEILKMDHTGWFVDDMQDELAKGVVYRLNHGRGFLYGYEDWNNDGCDCLSVEIADNEKDAARWGDQIAERLAESERENQEANQAGKSLLSTTEGHVMLTPSQLFQEFRLMCDGSDLWGTSMIWMFAIAGEMHTRGMQIPNEWEYRPGVCPKEPGQYETEVCEQANDMALRFVGRALNRYTNILKRAGKDY